MASESETKRPGEPEVSKSAPHVLIQADRRARDPIAISAPMTAWRLFGWFGFLLVVIAGSDVLLQWYPTAFASPEWEFGTAAVTIASLPLLTIGAVVLLASFLARAKRGAVITMGGVFVFLFLAVGAVLVLFALDIPLALHAPAGGPLMAVKKAIARTAIMGCAYEVAFLGAAILAFRYAFGRVKDN